jgi:steroid delta-isomerase-like uncharacterized protein
MSPQATALSPKLLTEAAEAPILAYNEKDWNKVRTCVTPNFVYDEIATHRRAKGPDEVIRLWQGWAAAFPDSKATIHNALVSGESVVLELTWKGTHKGPLQMGETVVAPTGRAIELRACVIADLIGEKVALERQYFDIATLQQQIGMR